MEFNKNRETSYSRLQNQQMEVEKKVLQTLTNKNRSLSKQREKISEKQVAKEITAKSTSNAKRCPRVLYHLLMVKDHLM